MTVEEFFHELIKGNDAPLKELEKLVTKESNTNRTLSENQLKTLRERNYTVFELIQNVRRINEAQNNTSGLPTHATIKTFKESGKYYTEDKWRIPEGAISPHDMAHSPDFRQISPGWTILVDTQYPWGFPAIIKNG